MTVAKARVAVVEGHVLPAVPKHYQVNMAAFDLECTRIWREVVRDSNLGYDPLAITAHVAHIVMDPWSRADTIPHYARNRPTPALMPKQRSN